VIFHIITLFPESFKSIFTSSILKRAIEKKVIKINFINPRDFAANKHKTVDDKPYGGGKGMVMKVDVLTKAIESIKPKPYTILLSASGKKYTQKTAQILAAKKNIALVCGHYEGIDQRVEKYVDEILSIGDFVLTGGEIPAMAIVDSITRLLPGVISEGSAETESFSILTNRHPELACTDAGSVSGSILESPQYTRPENFRGTKVPKVLLSGNHKQIEQWRQKESQKRTAKFRPDLIAKRLKTKAKKSGVSR